MQDVEFRLSRRIKAARELAGLTSAAKLAEEVGEGGLGQSRLEKLEREVGHVELRDLQAIATACHLPVEFFTVDFEQLPKIAPANPKKVIAEQLRAALERSEAKRADKREDPPPPQAEDQAP